MITPSSLQASVSAGGGDPGVGGVVVPQQAADAGDAEADRHGGDERQPASPVRWPDLLGEVSTTTSGSVGRRDDLLPAAVIG